MPAVKIIRLTCDTCGFVEDFKCPTIGALHNQIENLSLTWVMARMETTYCDRACETLGIEKIIDKING